MGVFMGFSNPQANPLRDPRKNGRSQPGSAAMAPVAASREDPQLGIFKNQVIWEEKAVAWVFGMVEPRGTELEKP